MSITAKEAAAMATRLDQYIDYEGIDAQIVSAAVKGCYNTLVYVYDEVRYDAICDAIVTHYKAQGYTVTRRPDGWQEPAKWDSGGGYTWVDISWREAAL